jgi:hypothetical protein
VTISRSAIASQPAAIERNGAKRHGEKFEDNEAAGQQARAIWHSAIDAVHALNGHLRQGMIDRSRSVFLAVASI